MSDKQLLFTFHKVREQCEGPNADAWRAFVSMYGPLLLRQLDLYFPGDKEAGITILEKLVGQLMEDNFARFRAMPRQSEREFLIDARALLLDLAKESAAAPLPQSDHIIDPEKLEQLLNDLPLMHQEMLFFKLSGYTDLTIEHMLRVAPRVAEKAMERLAPAHSAAQKNERDACPWPAEWLALLQEARAGKKKDDCKELHEFMRIQDGQVSWYEKEPIEKHVTACLYCLERWTALREVVYGRRVAAPLDAAVIEGLVLTVPGGDSPKKSMFRRVFG